MAVAGQFPFTSTVLQWLLLGVLQRYECGDSKLRHIYWMSNETIYVTFYKYTVKSLIGHTLSS
jgi:hypothetical protein